MTTAFIGQPVSRVDGRQKVTGAATYAAEFDQPGQAYGVIVRSTVANGRIASMDSTAAQRASGVLAVLTHATLPDWPIGGTRASRTRRRGTSARAPG